MWIPQENKEGYEAGNAMNYADKLKGRLMIYYGTADNNVHPNNSMQLIQALQRAGKSFEVQVGPDVGPLRHQAGADDGVLHREPGDEWDEAITDLTRTIKGAVVQRAEEKRNLFGPLSIAPICIEFDSLDFPLTKR